MVVKELRLAFIPIPKTGTTSIKKALSDIPSDDLSEIHFSLPTMSSSVARKKGYFIFTFVRNPFDRIVSVWADRLAYRYPGETRLALRRTGFKAGMKFGPFVRQLEEIGLEVDPHLKRQVDFLFANGKLQADFVGRFERMGDDWRRLQMMFPSLPDLLVLNKSNHGAYRDHYGGDTRDRVKALYDEDWRRLGYAF